MRKWKVNVGEGYATPLVVGNTVYTFTRRDGDEVRRVGAQQTAPSSTPVYNPAFDVTPAALISAIITERGIFRPPYLFATGGGYRGGAAVAPPDVK